MSNAHPQFAAARKFLGESKTPRERNLRKLAMFGYLYGAPMKLIQKLQKQSEVTDVKAKP